MCGSQHPGELGLRRLDTWPAIAAATVLARSAVLDTSARDGAVARALQRMGCRTYGVDTDPDLVRQARAWCEEVVVGDVEQLPLSELLGPRFDVVLLLDGLQHRRDPVLLLRNVTALLRDGGYLVLTVNGPTETGGVGDWLVAADLEVLYELRDAPAGRPSNGEPGSERQQHLVLAAPTGSQAVNDPPLLPALLLHQEMRSGQGDTGLNRTTGPEKELLLDELAQLRLQSEMRTSILEDLLVTAVDEFKQARTRLPVDGPPS